MEQTVKERIIIFINAMGITPSAFERKAKLSNGYLNQLRNSPSLSKITDIINAFPELNRNWLLTGEGEMLVPSQTTGDINADNSTVAANIGGNNQQNSGLVIETLARQLDEKDRQIDRLLGIIEKMS